MGKKKKDTGTNIAIEFVRTAERLYSILALAQKEIEIIEKQLLEYVLNEQINRSGRA